MSYQCFFFFSFTYADTRS